MLRCRLIAAVVLLATFTAVSAKAGSVDLLANGQFTNGLSGFISQYANNQASTSKEGAYAVLANPHLADRRWGNFQAPLGGDLMSVNGAANRNLFFWSETVGVRPNSTYTFTLWARTNTPKKAAALELRIDGTPVGAPLQLSKHVGKWVAYTVTWYSGADTSTDLQLFDRNTRGTGNDFSIADLSFTGLGPAQVTIPISGPGTGSDPGSGTGVGLVTGLGAGPGPTAPSVPEPATWTLLILGTGMLGAALRRRPPALA